MTPTESAILEALMSLEDPSYASSLPSDLPELIRELRLERLTGQARAREVQKRALENSIAQAQRDLAALRAIRE
jgi:hypothetical protein